MQDNTIDGLSTHLPVGRGATGVAPPRSLSRTAMNLLSNLRRIADALLTALAVVIGLTPDPTQSPVPVRADDEPRYRR
ncbi:MAG TPA: hypothetical protein VKX16_05800 [Chloroflexota bacterium]|nr:hypothetical protein [Chloroflexota bacterium]